jgi:3',5'-cyclic AMP phosphodiesterase CpdA
MSTNLLHISDLHFVEKLTERGRALWLKVAGPKSHAFAYIDALSAEYHALTARTPIDVLLATGDISTDGDMGSLQTALKFLENGEIREERSARPVTTGLRVSKDRRLILPGNHDRYNPPFVFQVPSDKLESVFSTEKKYPYLRAFRPAGPTPNSSPTLLFAVFDSTPKGQASSDPWVNPLYRIARGRVEDEECQWLTELPRFVKAAREIPSVAGAPVEVDYESAIRIVVIHHHPVSVRLDGKLSSLTLMENHKAFVRACLDARIDIVLFGHEHTEYYCAKPIPVDSLSNRHHTTHFFCCPSTSEFHAKKPGFYLFSFERSHVTVTPFSWQKRGFKKQSPRSLRLDRSTR